MTVESAKNVVKLAVVGDGGVGKSTLISRLSTGDFIERKITVGFDIESWTFSANGGTNPIKVACFDFGGQQQFRFFQGSLILGAKAALIVFDCTSFRSLERIHEWMDLLAGVPDNRKLLVGNKIDAGINISDDSISKIADELGLDYILISSKTGENFQQLMDLLKVIVSDA